MTEALDLLDRAHTLLAKSALPQSQYDPISELLIRAKAELVVDAWLSPIEQEREWQICHLRKIWAGWPDSCPNWQTLNGLIMLACENVGVTVDREGLNV